MDHHYSLASRAPLCPAGHLPHRGGDRLGACSSDHINRSTKRRFFEKAKFKPRVISPLVGEMSGRTEGGNSNHQSSDPAPMAGSRTRKIAR